MWQAHNQDSEEMEGMAVPAVVFDVDVKAAWYERLREVVEGGRSLKVEEHDGSVKRWRYVELRLWERGCFAVVARKTADPLNPPILVCEDFDEAYVEFWEQVDELWPGAG